MLFIVAHHYVVNSGLLNVMGQDPLSIKSLLLYWFGMWGKTGINCFVLITGYFMCQSSITIRKFLKLLLEIELYKILIYTIFVLTGYENFSLNGLVMAILPTNQISTNFSGCFLFFYLCIPFLNILIHNLNQRKHLLLIVLCLIMYTVYSTVPRFHVTMNYVSWFCVLYFLSSYIRMYGFITPPYTKSKNCIGLISRFFRGYTNINNCWGWLTFAMVLLSMISVTTTIFINRQIGLSIRPYRWVEDSNALLAVLTAICSFMYFKDLNIKYNRFINLVGSCTFGVLLIHANSDTMRHWLWKDILDNVGFYSTNYCIVHAVLSVIMIFCICTLIDYLRQLSIEKWIFKYIDTFLQKHNLK